MDEKTLEVYRQHAREFVERDRTVPSPIRKFFTAAFASLGPGARLVDVGAGTGREVAALLDEGFDAYGIEPSDALRDAAVQLYPALIGRLREGALPALPSDLRGRFSGLVCSAVLQHLPRHELPEAVEALLGLLGPGGRALISLPLPGRAGLDGEGRDALGRLYTELTPDELQAAFAHQGFRCIQRWQDEDVYGRGDVRWATLLFERNPTLA